jgi:hypothetical protein
MDHGCSCSFREFNIGKCLLNDHIKIGLYKLRIDVDTGEIEEVAYELPKAFGRIRYLLKVRAYPRLVFKVKVNGHVGERLNLSQWLLQIV